jgi:hypothetical protein
MFIAMVWWIVSLAFFGVLRKYGRLGHHGRLDDHWT